MPRALIVGHSGQDGRILWDQLAAQGFSLIGLSRHELRLHQSRWDHAVNISERESVRSLVSAFRPDHIYYLAAYHHSSQDETVDDAAVWQASWAVHVQGFAYFLEAVRECHPPARVFYAGSSRVFGDASVSPQRESTPFRPTCLYGITKASAMMLGDYYRRVLRLFVSSGILFNHESPLRGRQFVSQRVVRGLVGIKAGRSRSLQIGNLDTRVDWGYAPDYTRAMQMILEAHSPEDFVIASGETHSVREMLEIAAECLDISWEKVVIENPQILQRSPQGLCGDPSRLRQATGWAPGVPFRDMVRILVDAALAGEVWTSAGLPGSVGG